MSETANYKKCQISRLSGITIAKDVKKKFSKYQHFSCKVERITVLQKKCEKNVILSQITTFKMPENA